VFVPSSAWVGGERLDRDATGPAESQIRRQDVVAEASSGDLTPGATHTASEGRRRVRDACSSWPTEQVQTAELLTTELVANALQHGRGLAELLVEVSGRLLRVEVRDRNPSLPGFEPEVPDPEDEHGRGLFLVATFATSWGMRPDRDSTGKTVWFELYNDG
jgi:anti-sigma regulatory factor (Ser/Thr protein kinase)